MCGNALWRWGIPRNIRTVSFLSASYFQQYSPRHLNSFRQLVRGSAFISSFYIFRLHFLSMLLAFGCKRSVRKICSSNTPTYFNAVSSLWTFSIFNLIAGVSLLLPWFEIVIAEIIRAMVWTYVQDARCSSFLWSGWLNVVPSAHAPLWILWCPVSFASKFFKPVFVLVSFDVETMASSSMSTSLEHIR